MPERSSQAPANSPREEIGARTNASASSPGEIGARTNASGGAGDVANINTNKPKSAVFDASPKAASADDAPVPHVSSPASGDRRKKNSSKKPVRDLSDPPRPPPPPAASTSVAEKNVSKGTRTAGKRGSKPAEVQDRQMSNTELCLKETEDKIKNYESNLKSMVS